MTFTLNADANLLFPSNTEETLNQEKVFLQYDFQNFKERIEVLEEVNNQFYVFPIERVDFTLYENQQSIPSPEVNSHRLKAYEELEIEYGDFDYGTGY
tara:strand:+ start:145 stop:438 length:294 start_codon:yes stop_codon:yes gene_type:complete